MGSETDELITYFRKIAEKSHLGDIPWNQPSPTTFQWTRETNDDQLIVTIQRAASTKIRYSNALNVGVEQPAYMFQVQSRASRQVIMSISSAERPELQDVLSDIFEGAERGIDVRSKQILSKLLE